MPPHPDPVRPASITAAALADRIGGRVEGDPTTEIRDVAGLGDAGPHHVTFAVGEANEARVGSSSAGCFIVRDDFLFAETFPRGRSLIRHRSPQLGFAAAVRILRPEPPLLEPGVDPRAAVHPTAEVRAGAGVGALAVVERGAVIAEGALVMPLAYVGAGARVGAGSVIHPGAVIARGCEVGARCIVHSGAVIGADGFGFAPDPDTGLPQKLPQVGRVVIEDDVEVGANTTIDRAALGETRIRRGVKIDNLVQVGHNVEVGMGSIIVAQAGISGSTKIGRGVIVAAQAGIVDHVTIGDRAIIGASAGVTKDVKPGEAVLGQPAIPAGQAKRALALVGRLPDMAKELRRIDKRLDELEAERPK